METIPVSSAADLVEHINGADEIELSGDAAEDCWRLWHKRQQRGSDTYLVAVANWVSRDKFDANRPVFFAEEEYDNADKGAVLFSDIRTIDHNILEAGMYDDVSVNELLEPVDRSDTEHIDEPGLAWIPRTSMMVFEYDV